jgi:chromate transporter
MKPSLSYLFITFLRIGATSWGGFMALIAMIQKRVVDKDKIIDNEVIMDGISLASILPGPMAVNVVSFVGYKLRGVKGSIVCVTAILIPSFVLMIVLSHFYLEYGDLPFMNHFFAGVLPAVAGIIVSVAFSMGKKNVQDIPQVMVLVITVFFMYLYRTYWATLGALFASGMFGYLYYFHGQIVKNVASTETYFFRKSLRYLLPIGLILITVTVLLRYSDIVLTDFWDLQKTIFTTFAGISVTQFGGGYVVIPAMQKIIVEGLHWLSDQQFVDAIAMGQITPGPIFISATFIGYKIAGMVGALNATISIFAPTAILTIICARFFNRIRKSVVINLVFKGLRPAIIGMIISAAITIMMNHGITYFSGSIFVLTLLIVVKFKIDPAYIIPVAGIVGLLVL